MPRKVRNILFIMCDQLRWDYLSCYGHPHLQTPHIDSLAARGVRFDRAYVQSPLCGPSRACTYTGRTMFAHGVTWNNVPLRVDEWTMGDYLRDAGMRTVLVGKTHMVPDWAGLRRLGVERDSAETRYLTEAGFEPFERDDGLHPDPILDPNLRYNRWLNAHGYPGRNPWQTHANSAVDEHGNVVDGWLWRNSVYPANIAAEHSETAYMTTRAIEFMEQAGDQLWCLHLSFIKPHWPYIAPAPYHALYGDDAILPAVRDAVERRNPHPVYDAFMRLRFSRVFEQETHRRAVVGAYMGLVKQIDDEIGRLLTYLRKTGLFDKTLIVFTSDHGDYLGDHWLGEKDLFHEPSVRMPLIIVDPSSSADKTRGTVERRLVEAIDLLPTFLDVVGGQPHPQRLEGRSLVPLLHGDPVSIWREFTVSEIDYSGRAARHLLGLQPQECRAFMLRTKRWKYILHEQFRPQLFDLDTDPQEFVDLGDDPGYAGVRHDLHEQLFTWLRRRKLRATMMESAEATVPYNPDYDPDAEAGIFIGYW